MNSESFVKKYGYIKLYIYGENANRFLNILSWHGVKIFKVCILNEGYCFFTSNKNYNIIEQIGIKTNTNIKIIKQGGLIKYINRWKSLMGIWIGIVLFFLLIIYLTNHIWDISITGNLKYKDEDLIQYVKGLNIYEGMSSKKIDCDMIETKIRGRYFDIAWVCAEIRGTRLLIHIKEGLNLDTKKIDEEPKDIVADRDGKVVSIITRNGTPLVKPKDIVKKGDVLVSGLVNVFDDNGEISNTIKVNADSDIIIEYTDYYKDKIKINDKIKEYTGKTETGFLLSAFDNRTNFMWEDAKYDNYDVRCEENKIKILRNLYIPVKYGKITYMEYNLVNYKFSKEELKEKSSELVNLYSNKLINENKKIMQKIINTKQEINYYYINAKFTCRYLLLNKREIDYNALPNKYINGKDIKVT